MMSREEIEARIPLGIPFGPEVVKQLVEENKRLREVIDDIRQRSILLMDQDPNFRTIGYLAQEALGEK